jgi:hypothetical protein
MLEELKRREIAHRAPFVSACIKAPEQHRKNRAFSEQLVGKFFEDGSLEKLQKLKKLEEHGGADQGENQIRCS